MKCPNKSGFTVVELIVYLGVIAGTLLINLTLIRVVNVGSMQETSFWRSVHNSWTEADNDAQLHKRAYFVQIQPHQIVFVPGNQKQKQFLVEIPKELHPGKVITLRINADGFVSPNTINWLTKDGRVKYVQKIQMGWSGYELEQKF
ncbi:MAG: hypothetical protein ABF679_11550 [Lentilactobacillus diolivorans]|uniref:hypothetical protein n=1 Tax=Lentilactobacillus diolivorans TaxID=179838 RepID=UPI0039E8415F